MSRAKKICQNSEQKPEFFENIGSSVIPNSLRIQLMLNALQFNNNNLSDVSQRQIGCAMNHFRTVIPDFRAESF